MSTFTILFYTLETIFYSITYGSESRLFFLYEKGLKKYNDSNIERIKSLALDKLVIYISKTNFVGFLTLNYPRKFEVIESCNVCVAFNTTFISC